MEGIDKDLHFVSHTETSNRIPSPSPSYNSDMEKCMTTPTTPLLEESTCFQMLEEIEFINISPSAVNLSASCPTKIGSLHETGFCKMLSFFK